MKITLVKFHELLESGSKDMRFYHHYFIVNQRNFSSGAKKVFYPFMYDRTDGWTRQWAKELTVNIFFDVFHILFKKKTFSHCMRNFSHSMRNFLHGQSASPPDSQDHPKAVSVTPKKFLSPISSQRHP